MKSRIRSIGNSKGIIIPQSFLRKCFIQDEVNIEVRDNRIVITPAEDVKGKGWADAFKEMVENGDDQLLVRAIFDDENIAGWKWDK